MASLVDIRATARSGLTLDVESSSTQQFRPLKAPSRTPHPPSKAAPLASPVGGRAGQQLAKQLPPGLAKL